MVNEKISTSNNQRQGKRERVCALLEGVGSMVYGFIYTTVSSLEEAEGIAQYLVEKKWAACANIIPNMRSYYEDQGKVTAHGECVLILKTRQSLWTQIECEIKKLHSYDCPCLVFIPFKNVSSSFLKWMSEKVVSEV